MRAIDINLRKIFSTGVLSGLLFFMFLFILSLLLNAGFSVLGVENSEVAKLVKSAFWPDVLAAQLKILFVYMVLGFVLGTLSEFVSRNTPLRFMGKRILLIVLANFYFLLSAIKKYPQLFTESFYYRGAIGREIQLVATDYLSDWFFIGFELLLIALVLLAANNWLKKRFRVYVVPVIAIIILIFISFRIFKTAVIYFHSAGTRSEEAVNIIVIAADSLRPDRLGYSGYERNLTPNIDSIAKEGVIFKSHFSCLPRTFPAMVSLLTGKLPVTHGVRHMFPSKWERDHLQGSLPEILRQNGYKSAVVSDFAGDIFSRVNLGFDIVKAPYFNFVTLIDQRSLEIHCFLLPYVANSWGRKIFPELKEFANNADPDVLADETISVLDRLSKNNKFFCMSFFSNIHFPYASPYPYYKKFTPKSYIGRYKYHKPPALFGKETLTDDDLIQIRGLYDGSVVAFDNAVGKIKDYLVKKGIYDKTIIIITADHGENLYENNWHVGHGEHLRGQNVIRIPLIIKFPTPYLSKNDVTALSRDIDFMPTILDYIGSEIPANIDGQSFIPYLSGSAADPGLKAFSETGIWFSDRNDGFYQKERIMYPDITTISRIDYTYNLEVVLKEEYSGIINIAKHRMIDDGRYRLIYAPSRTGIKYQLYDYQSDPMFRNDISGEMPEKLIKMKKMLFEYIKKDVNVRLKSDYVIPADY